MMQFSFDKYFSDIHSRVSNTGGSTGDWIAIGCSHTAGYGVAPGEIYVDLLSKHYNKLIHNLGLGSTNHVVCKRNAQLWFDQIGKPGLVIAQWPNVIRRTTWTGNSGMDVTASVEDPIIQIMLRCGEQNFYADWLDSVITLNQFCRWNNTTVVNILLEDLSIEYHNILNKHGIVMHDDKKYSGLSWIFDNAGTDGFHHSAHCHKLWAKRLIGIIDELT